MSDRVDRPPEGLTVLDLQAILTQAVDPEARYLIDGWILRALADELLSHRAGTARKKRPAHVRPLFDPPEPSPSHGCADREPPR